MGRAYPDLVRLTSLATTPEGREVWLLTIGTEPDRIRPAVWVDGNMHAAELAGSSVALAIAEDVLRAARRARRARRCRRRSSSALREVLFYVVPRISPDGAECVLTTGRSCARCRATSASTRGQPRWMPTTSTATASSLAMRVHDPGGELVEAREFPGLLVERTLEDEGPFYKVYPEGGIEHFDGKRIPSPYFLGDNPIDLNRNFPWSWAPAHEQVGAGAVPGERARGARRRRVRDARTRDLRVAATSTRSAAC